MSSGSFGSAVGPSPYRSAKNLIKTQSTQEILGENTNSFGGKNIGYFAGIALLINNITGPGVRKYPRPSRAVFSIPSSVRASS